MSLGVSYLGDGRTAFELWTPSAHEVSAKLMGPADRTVPMQREGDGCFRFWVTGVEPGARCFYVLDGHALRADPASKCQPKGVHGPSEAADIAFEWTDGERRRVPDFSDAQWRGPGGAVPERVNGSGRTQLSLAACSAFALASLGDTCP